MSKQDHEHRHGGNRTLGNFISPQTGYMIMIGHLYYEAAGGVVNIAMGQADSAEEPAVIMLDIDAAEELVEWIQRAISMCRECS